MALMLAWHSLAQHTGGGEGLALQQAHTQLQSAITSLQQQPAADRSSRCCSKLLALHQLSVLRHDEYCQETLVNLLIRSFLHYNMYEQARPWRAATWSNDAGQAQQSLARHGPPILQQADAHLLQGPSTALWLRGGVLRPSAHAQAEQLRARAQRPAVDRSAQQVVRYLFYHGRICAIQLDYSDAKDLLSQAVRKVPASCRWQLWQAPGGRQPPPGPQEAAGIALRPP